MTVPPAVYLMSQRIEVVRAENLHHQSEPDPLTGESHAHRAYGIYEEAEQRITLDANLAFERSRETFLHENIHAMVAIAGIDAAIPDEANEHVVSVLAPVLLSWMRDNPEAVAFLMETQ